jgi:hypothetical protein
MVLGEFPRTKLNKSDEYTICITEVLFQLTTACLVHAARAIRRT